MVEREVTVTNRLGLHARAAARFVQMANAFEADIRIGHQQREVNGKSLLGVLTLAAAHGSSLRIVSEGPDEVEAAKALADLVHRGFDQQA